MNIPEEHLQFLFWYLAEHQAMIDCVGGSEWFSRHHGTDLTSKEWLTKYREFRNTKAFQKAAAVVDDIKKTRDGLCQNCQVNTPGYPPDYCLTYDYLCYDCDEKLYLEEQDARFI